MARRRTVSRHGGKGRRRRAEAALSRAASRCREMARCQGRACGRTRHGQHRLRSVDAVRVAPHSLRGEYPGIRKPDGARSPACARGVHRGAADEDRQGERRAVAGRSGPAAIGFGRSVRKCECKMQNAKFKMQTGLATESYHIPSVDAGIQIYVRNTRPADLTSFSPARTLLFVHGATYPSDTMFALKIDGESWMDFIASHGYDVYAMDVRGYGRSTRPAEMERPPDDNPPVVSTDDGVRDFAAVVDHIRDRRGITRVNLMGWSWG